jgi:hypothetical protein
MQFNSIGNGFPYSMAERCKMNITGTTIINGSAGSAFVTANSANADLAVTINVITGGFTNFFNASGAGVISGPVTWSGANPSGAKYACGTNAVISLTTTYPVSLTAGSAATGCQANPP